jgi:hypothetical protein
MSWKCPACQSPIRHGEVELTPRPGVIYRCLVCRLELIKDPHSDKMTVAPLPSDSPAKVS